MYEGTSVPFIQATTSPISERLLTILIGKMFLIATAFGVLGTTSTIAKDDMGGGGGDSPW
jgi:hypothetical protein